MSIARWVDKHVVYTYKGILLLVNHLVMSNSLQPPGLQHARISCPSLSSGVCSNFMSIDLVMPSNNLILCLSLLLLPSIFPSIRIISKELALCIRWPKYWSFSFSIGPSNDYSGLISFRIDWFDLLAVQETFKTFLYHYLKASILQCLAFFIQLLSHLYMTIIKTIALTRWTFVGKVMSLFFNTLSRFVIASLPRSKHLLISWLQSPCAVILETKQIKPVTVSTFSLSICDEVMEPDAMILVFRILSFKPAFSLSFHFTFI